MTTRTREYVCEDCKANVFEFGYPTGEPNLCNGCKMIREMKAAKGLTAKQEADLREILHCLIPPPEPDDALRAENPSPD